MNRRLYRSPDDRVVAGVAGGMAETYDMDPSVVRVVWALLILLTGGLFLILYIVMALVVPLQPGDEPLAYQGAAGTEPPDPNPPPPEVGGPAWPSMSSQDRHRARRRESGAGADSSGPIVLGGLLILVGAFFLLREFIPALDLSLLWPVLVIIGGILLIAAAIGRR